MPTATPTGRSTGRRAHPALGARIGVAGIGTTTMLGLVAIMGMAQQGGTEVGAASSATAAAPTAAPAPMVVVIHRPAPAGEPTATTVDPATAAAVDAANRGPDPVVLTARPSVHVVAAPAAAPAAPRQSAAVPEARTNGSR